MRFPTERLMAKGGQIYAHLFENRATRLERNVFWSVRIDFVPLNYGGAEVECSMTCEWIRWPIRSWTELDGRSLDVEYGHEGTESCFYLTGHHVGRHTSLSLRRIAESLFAVQMIMNVEFTGYYGGDEQSIRVCGQTQTRYDGLLVVPENLDPRPGSAEDAKAAVAPFADMRDYGEPQVSPRGYLFPPLAEAPTR